MGDGGVRSGAGGGGVDPGGGATIALGPGAAARTGPARLWARLVGAEVRSTMEYPASFAFGALANVIFAALDLVAVAAVFANVDTLVGWDLDQVLVLYGMAHTSFYLADLAVGQLDQLPDLVRSGRLDVLLLRPRRVLFHVLSADVDLRSLGKLAQGVVVLVVGLTRVDVVWDPATVALLGVALVSGAVIYGSVWVVTTSITFWLVDSREVSSAFTYGGRQLASYPLGIYGEWIRHLVRLVIPLAFTAYYPTLGLLDVDDPLGAPGWLAWAGPPVALVTAMVAGGVWRTGVRAYRSTGA